MCWSLVLNQLSYNEPRTMFWSLQMISLLAIDQKYGCLCGTLIPDTCPLHSVGDGINSLEEAKVPYSIKQSMAILTNSNKRWRHGKPHLLLTLAFTATHVRRLALKMLLLLFKLHCISSKNEYLTLLLRLYCIPAISKSVNEIGTSLYWTGSGNKDHFGARNV